MITIALFIILGATVDAGAAYWICFGLYCFGYIIKKIYKLIKDDD